MNTATANGWASQIRQTDFATPHGGGTQCITHYTNTLGMQFVRIPGGTFSMGDTLTAEEVNHQWPGYPVAWYQSSHPRHRVRIGRSFYCGATQVTRGHYARFIDSTGYRTHAERRGKAWGFKNGDVVELNGVNWKAPLFHQADDHPVVCVCWDDVVAFCAWLSEKEGLRYRLPTEAEWEYAARAGDDGCTWYWGNEESGAQGSANVCDEGSWPVAGAFRGINDGHQYTSSVGSYSPNAFGLYDIIGNVWVWCNDWFGHEYYRQSPEHDPRGPATGVHRVVRGGSWLSLPQLARTAFRLGEEKPENSNTFLGFRVVCDGPTEGTE